MQTPAYLLDTHCLLWFQEDNPKIPEHVMEILQSPKNKIFFSQISLFKIAIKQKIGKLPDFKLSILEIYKHAIQDNFTFLTIINPHIETYQKVPLFEQHKDPFDRMLIATAYIENTIVLTADKNFQLYSDLIEVVW